MTMNERGRCIAAGAGMLVAALVCALPSGVLAQQPAPANQARPMPPGEVQRLFDAYTIIQAQQTLGLSDETFAAFLPRLRELQQVRRKYDQARQQLVTRLGRLAAADPINEAEIQVALKALADLDDQHAADMRRSYGALDETLDLRQRARFRAFEQQIERRKFDLMLRARRGGAPGVPPASR
ncbi:MAG: hypothetical protein AB1806_00685 [Acidobacteriota bacterium]